MQRIYKMLTESGEYNFKTRLTDRKEVKETFKKIFEKRFNFEPEFVEIINEGLLDFFKKKKKDNGFKNKEERNEVVKSENKSTNKSANKLFEELKKVRSAVTNILQSNKELLDSNEDFQSIKEHLQYVSKYVKYCYNGLQNAIDNKNIKDEDTISGTSKGIVDVRNMLGGKDYKNSDLSDEDAKKAWKLLTKVGKDKRTDEWYTYYNFLAKRFGKPEIGKDGKALRKMTKQKASTSQTKLHKTKPTENTNKKVRTVAQNQEREKAKKQKEMDDAVDSANKNWKNERSGG